jgi:outer membrane protein insertion porin family
MNKLMTMNLSLRLVLAGLLAFILNTSQAVEPFKVADIQVQGLQRVDPATVFAYLPIKVGDTANDNLIRDSIQSLFSTGLFADVGLQAQGNVLVLTLVERPFIASVSFAGNKELDSDELKKIARESGLIEGRAFDKAVLTKVEQDIKAAYLSKSKYGLKITSVSSPVERNRVNVLLELSEGDIARIKEIKILGAKKFTEKQLIDEMSSRTPGWMSWFTKSDRYAKEKLNADIEQIRNFYLSKGYFEFSVESSQVALSPDRQDVFLTIVVNEGKPFNVSKITVKGGSPDQTSDLEKLVKIKPNELFNGETFNDMLSKMNNRMGELGFASAQINPIPTVDYDKRLINFEVLLDAGPRTYVRKINVTGNTRTRDAVVRREMRQIEAAWYDAEKIRQSRDRVDRLGFFKEVNVDSVPVDGRPDQVDLNFAVVEKPTGNINFGVGFNSTDKLSITAGITQDNIFGSGNNLSFNVNTAKTNRAVYLSATDPYYTQSGISRTVEVYARTNKLEESGVKRVDINTRGASLRFGVPFTETDTVYAGLGVEYTGLKVHPGAASRYVALDSTIAGAATYPLWTLGWGNDTRDSALSPSKGTLQRAGFEAGTGSEIGFAKLTYQYQKFYPITKDFTWAGNIDVGYGAGLGSKTYPFFKNFYAGGIGSVRGYQGNTLGAQDTNGDHIGGAKKLVLNTEVLFPLPGTGKDRSAKLFAFIDGGYAWSENQKTALSDIRFSSGVGLSWQSPIGPLKFSYGVPIKKQASDKLQKFQFQIGTGF